MGSITRFDLTNRHFMSQRIVRKGLKSKTRKEEKEGNGVNGRRKLEKARKTAITYMDLI